MIKRLLKEVKEYKAASILTPIFMIGEVIFETLIPFIMGLIINNGINLEKLSYQFADWNRGQAENRTTQLIDQYGNNIEMIISNNDEMAIGAVEAYKKSGYGEDEWPIICGIDGLNDALIAVKEGQMQGTVYNDKEDQSMEIAKLVVDIFKGNDLKKHNLDSGKYYVSQYKKVDINNVDDFISR
jgi:methyl-galactoside transport system substrate-binding protein